MTYSTALRARFSLPITLKVLSLASALALGACNDPESDDDSDASTQPRDDEADGGSAADARVVDADEVEEDANPPTEEDAGSPDASDEADASDTEEPAAPGTCAFTVDGTEYEADITKIDTIALYYPATGDITVNCGITDGDVARIINLSVKAENGAGTYNGSVVQYSEQSTNGGGITQWRKFGADVVVTSVSETSVAATTSVDAAGAAGANKQISVRFNLTPKLR